MIFFKFYKYMCTEIPLKKFAYQVNDALWFFFFSPIEMEFPSSLTSTERAFIHRLSQSLGLVSKSKG